MTTAEVAARTESALIADIAAGNADAEGVYADWLEDQGRDEDAAVWRAPPAQRIDELTPAQLRLIPAWRDAWLAAGLTADPTVDRPLAQRLIGEAYRVAGLEPPTVWVYLDSPLRGAVGAAMLANPEIRQSVGDSVWQAVERSVWQSVEQSVDQSVEQSVGDSVWQAVGRSVRQSVWLSVWQSVWQSVGQSVGQPVWQSVWQACYGSQDAAWLSFHSYLLTVGRLACCSRLLPLIRLAGHVGWWWPFAGACVVTPRPSRLVMQRERLVEIEYPDGWGVKP